MASTRMSDATPHRILKSFPGSQTGNDQQFFTEGEVALLTPHLAEVAVAAGQAEPVSPEEAASHAADRETKVTGPEETKPFDITTLNEKQMVKFAKDNFGLKLNPKLSKDELLAAIEEHAAEADAA